MDPNDRAIYQAAIAGDRDAFETIIRGSSRQLFAVAYGVLQNRAEAEDVVQDAFIKAWKARWRVRDPEKFPAWIATIARNRARDVARRGRAELLVEQFEDVADEMSANQDEQAREAYLGSHVHRALAALPETHRIAISLRYFDALDYATIEQTLGLTNGALRGILGRALQTMRKRLQPALASID
jgi:RNA polymerase sigma-70 factor (ECF subfamily)